jgi:hypothetical protein
VWKWQDKGYECKLHCRGDCSAGALRLKEAARSGAAACGEACWRRRAGGMSPGAVRTQRSGDGPAHASPAGPDREATSSISLLNSHVHRVVA